MNSKIKFSSKGGTFSIGSCEMKTPEHALNRGQEVDTKIELYVNRELKAPEGYVRASSTLNCNPKMNFRKHSSIKIFTWFSAKESKDVDVTIFEELDYGWGEVDTFPLTSSGFIEIQVKKLSNITAFLSKKSLPDVEIMLKSYLFKKGNCVKACVGVDDEVFDHFLKSEMLDAGHHVIQEQKEKQTYGGKISYLSIDAKSRKHDGEASELNNFVEINDSFLDLKATPIYDLTERESNVIVEQPPSDQAAGSTAGHTMEFHGEVEAGAVVSNADHIHLDQRNTGSEQRNSSTVDDRPVSASGIQITSNNDRQHTRNGGHASLTVSTGPSGTISSMKFYGRVKSGLVVGDVKDLTIDQRRTTTNNENTNTRLASSVQAHGDSTIPIQAENGSNDSDDEYLDAAGTIEEQHSIFNSSFKTFSK